MEFQSVIVTRSYEQVVQQIQDAIRAGRYARGQRLPPERELSESFGVSRSVIREAIKVLSAMGLVESRQGSGSYVRNDPLPTVTRAFTLSISADMKSVAQIFEFRGALEALAACCAAARRSDEHVAVIHAAATATVQAAAVGDGAAFGDGDSTLHRVIRDAADNPYLAATLAAVREVQNDVVHLFIDLPGSMEIAADHHLRIAAAITAGDAERAATVMDEHIGYTARTVADLLAQTTEKGGSSLSSMER